MSDNITKAREFLSSYLTRNNTHLGEHSAVMALAEYADQFGSSDDGYKDSVIEGLRNDNLVIIEKNKELELKLEDALKLAHKYTEAHDEAIKQRDHNWNELQKAQKELHKLQTPVSGSK